MNLSQPRMHGPRRCDEQHCHRNADDNKTKSITPLLNTEIGGLVKEKEHDGLDDRRKIFKEADRLEDRALAQV